MDADITFYLTLAQNGDRKAENHVIRLIYERLRSMAGSLLTSERVGHTLQATALVSEVFLQKLRRISTPIQNREHYYSLAAGAMRQVLIDHARRNRAECRSLTRETVAELLMRVEDSVSVSEERLAVQQVFRALAEIDPGAAKIIHCRFVSGFTIAQTAARFNKPPWKIRADCDFGLSWMADHLGGSR